MRLIIGVVFITLLLGVAIVRGLMDLPKVSWFWKGLFIALGILIAVILKKVWPL